MKILSYNYEVVLDGTVDSIDAFGRQHPKSQRIQIAKDLCEEQKTSTLLHEIIEALNYHLQLKLEHPQIMSLEVGFYQVLKDNGVDLAPLEKMIK